ncbi:hypothetical protein ElyMa_006400500 [Elysia marginata]|uniref:Uncharacterized protein n=1 Tax=Elysia marginata TaxID=1093978 RepID=A0AAV4HSS4_9GAST|nr:hypothetical protein ElyMa_006400500 [Elysia marginata]
MLTLILTCIESWSREMMKYCLKLNVWSWATRSLRNDAKIGIKLHSVKIAKTRHIPLMTRASLALLVVDCPEADIPCEYLDDFFMVHIKINIETKIIIKQDKRQPNLNTS